MKKFLYRISIFILPAIAWMCIEAILPPTTFTHRHFEALEFTTNVPHQNDWYPNIKSSMSAVGDLCYHTANAVVKNEVWNTDKLGFRNDTFYNSLDILLIGDSFILGTGLSQNQSLSNKLKSKLGNKVKIYCIAPYPSISEFDYYFQNKILSKPKLIIFSNNERNIPKPVIKFNVTKKKIVKETIKKIFGIGNFNVYLDKAFRLYSFKLLKAKIMGSKGKGIPAIGNSKMYFLNGENQIYNDSKIYLMLKTLISYKNYCDSLKIDFLYVPSPNKESVYYDLVPFKKQPTYLFKLDSLLKLNNIHAINTLKICNDFRKTNSELLYHLDDTHWNENATELLAREIAIELHKMHPLIYNSYLSKN